MQEVADFEHRLESDRASVKQAAKCEEKVKKFKKICKMNIRNRLFALRDELARKIGHLRRDADK